MMLIYQQLRLSIILLFDSKAAWHVKIQQLDVMMWRQTKDTTCMHVVFLHIHPTSFFTWH